MAKQIVVTFVDDLDGTEASGTVKFGLDGTEYEIDLSAANEDKLRQALAPFLVKARPVKGARGVKAGRAGRKMTLARGRTDRDKSRKIREWAKAHGYPVSERGRIAADIVAKYEAAH